MSGFRLDKRKPFRITGHLIFHIRTERKFQDTGSIGKAVCKGRQRKNAFLELDGLVSYHAGGIVDGLDNHETSIRIRRDIDSDYGISLVDGGSPAGRCIFDVNDYIFTFLGALHCIFYLGSTIGGNAYDSALADQTETSEERNGE